MDMYIGVTFETDPDGFKQASTESNTLWKYISVCRTNTRGKDPPLTAVQTNGATHPVAPVNPSPPHWPYSATVPAAAED